MSMKQFTLSSNNDKALLGAYFNMASDNLYKALVQAFESSGLVFPTAQEEKVAAVLIALHDNICGQGSERRIIKDVNSGERDLIGKIYGKVKTDFGKEEKLRTMLFRHFPVLAPIVSKNKDKEIQLKAKKRNGGDSHQRQES